MTAVGVRGAPIAKLIRAQVSDVAAGAARPPCLLNVVVGDRGDSLAYLDALDRAAEKRGMTSRRTVLPADADTDAVVAAVTAAADDDSVDGLMIQMPLPKHVDRERVTACVPAAKDVDGVTLDSLGAVLSGVRRHTAPATAAAVVEILSSDEALDPAGRHVVVVGRSLVVGRPLAAMLTDRGAGGNATVTVCHTRTPDLALHTRQADIIVAAAGVKHLLKPEHVREGAIVIDVGTHPVERDDGTWGLTGDVHPDVAEVAGWLTPVPGGVGTVTTALLMRHVAAAACPGAVDPAW